MDPKEQFYRGFQASVTALQEEVSRLSIFSTVGGERQDAVEHILTGISRLSNEVADAAEYVPAYDQRTYTQAIKALTDQLNETTSKLTPKSRFQFKPRTTKGASSNPRHDARHFVSGDNTSSTLAPTGGNTEEQRDGVGILPTFTKNYNEEIARATTTGIRKPSFSAAHDITISGHEKLHIILPTSAARATSAGAITNMKGCIVDMSVPTVGGTPFASLALKNIAKCLIVAGNVNGPTHITNVKDSILVVVAKQVRIHECENVDIYLHCTSRPIIEDCKGMRFAPAPQVYITESEKSKVNQWDQVDDFKWLKADHSPNWKVLQEDDRLLDNIWITTVPGIPGVSADDILGQIGILSR